MTLEIARFATLLFWGFATAIFVGTWWTEQALRQTTSVDLFLTVHMARDAVLKKVMPVVCNLGLIGSVAINVLGAASVVPWVLSLVGTAGMVIAIGISIFVDVPINRQMEKWSAEDYPDDWGAIRDRWEGGHTGRTIAASIAMLCHIAVVSFPSFLS